MNKRNLCAVMSFEPPSILIKRFSASQNTSQKEARVRFDQTKKFLLVCGTDRSRRFCPSQVIDEMWHAFMLHSRSYFSFCDLIGGYIHHEPSATHDPVAYLNTLKSLQKAFGQIDEKYWADATMDCSGCGACSSCGP